MVLRLLASLRRRRVFSRVPANWSKMFRANDSQKAVHNVLRVLKAGDLEDFDMLVLERRGCAIDIRRSAGMVRVLLAPDCSRM